MNIAQLIAKLRVIQGQDPMFEVSAVSNKEYPIGKLVLLSGEVGDADNAILQSQGLRKDEAGDYWFLDLEGTGTD